MTTRFYLEQFDDKGDRLKVRSIPDWIAATPDDARAVGAIVLPRLLSGDTVRVVLRDTVRGKYEELEVEGDRPFR